MAQLEFYAPLIRELGRVAYTPTFEQMQALTSARGIDTPDEFWLLEHPPVFTLGQAGLESHLLHATQIPLVHTDRGGQITYHGPGQVVIYMLLDLKRRGMMIKEWVRRIEEAIILTLRDYGLQTERHEGAPGIYIRNDGTQTHAGAKIAALGLKVKNGCTYHGLSLNVAMELSPFLQINPCGYAGLETVDMRTMGVDAAQDEVARKLANYLTEQWQMP
ncbi:MAG: lipoyl(octanoyl) transferase LipB [Burkholderiales bacterium]|jgi:lipoyl(octanoyl) transferase|nr:lipoyl(octanoyl) transferase LipB [Burkholderiales bacterium]